MSTLHRLSAAFSGVLLVLHLTMVGGASVCAMQGGAAAMSGHGAHAMHGMSAGASHQPHRGAAISSTPATSAGCMAQSDGCGSSCVPVQCAASAMCGDGPAIAALVAPRTTAPLDPRVDVDLVGIRSGPPGTPELPPPRA